MGAMIFDDHRVNTSHPFADDIQASDHTTHPSDARDVKKCLEDLIASYCASPTRGVILDDCC